MATKYDFNLYKGETFSETVTVRDANSNYVNLTGYILTGICKYNFCNSGYLLNLNPSISSPTSGQVTLTVHYTGTTGLPVTKIPYNLNGYISGTSEMFYYGNINVFPGIIGTLY
jgi:hypothetical protein